MKNDRTVLVVKEMACAKALWDRPNGVRAELAWGLRRSRGDGVVNEGRSLVVIGPRSYAKELALSPAERRVLVSRTRMTTGLDAWLTIFPSVRSFRRPLPESQC